MPPLSSTRLEQTRAALLKLPRVAETLQWGDNLVFWTLDKAVGGKMFALFELQSGDAPPIAFAAGPERMPHLLEVEGVRPAPYLARAHWVAVDGWDVFSAEQLLEELHAAYAYVGGRMPTRVQRLYEMPAKEYRALVREKRAEAASQAR